MKWSKGAVLAVLLTMFMIGQGHDFASEDPGMSVVSEDPGMSSEDPGMS